MKIDRKIGITGLIFAAALAMFGCSKKENASFVPKLDTDKNVYLNVAGFFGNFEALDQVTADFNQYYPNVEFSYEQVSGDTFESYLEANPKVDIMMTSEEMFARMGDQLEDCCADLTKEGIDLSAIEQDMLLRGNHKGKQSYIPMGQNIYGMVVNTSLLKKEGLEIPENYEEFIKTLTALKEKGYVPIQGPDKKVYAELTQNVVFDEILADQELYEDLMAGKSSAADKLQPVMDQLTEIIDHGFTDLEINREYPGDNYDGAILKFFEGDVPFWICNTEKVSGMKKRETKSEAFQKNPFDYEFRYVPLGEKSAYAYREPWFGFSANTNGDHYEYAVEFLRFLATEDEINKMGTIKGIPSVAVKKTENPVYQYVLNPKDPQMEYVNDGTITPKIMSGWYECTSQYGAGEFGSGREALEYFVSSCKQ